MTSTIERAGLPPSQDAVCKGDWGLRTACGKCSRCMASVAAYIKTLRADHDMYIRAWMRELGGGDSMLPKTHLIDALVLTTRDIKAKADRWDREHGPEMPAWRFAELCHPWFEVS